MVISRICIFHTEINKSRTNYKLLLINYITQSDGDITIRYAHVTLKYYLKEWHNSVFMGVFNNDNGLQKNIV